MAKSRIPRPRPSTQAGSFPAKQPGAPARPGTPRPKVVVEPAQGRGSRGPRLQAQPASQVRSKPRAFSPRSWRRRNLIVHSGASVAQRGFSIRLPDAVPPPRPDNSCAPACGSSRPAPRTIRQSTGAPPPTPPSSPATAFVYQSMPRLRRYALRLKNRAQHAKASPSAWSGAARLSWQKTIST